MRRSISERDTWSGQVAFPGGKRQKRVIEGNDPNDIRAIKASETNDDVPWESPRETAQRETMEEIGLDLTSS